MRNYMNTQTMIRRTLRRTLKASSAVLLAAAFHAPQAHADVQEASRLLKQGQLPQALESVDQALSQKPKDPQTRFIKGLILAEMGKAPEAITIFQKLTEEYPELPEPYNNLAVLYAQQRQYDKAKLALEMAIRTHPSYAVAHENLGDVYARMASQAYDKALQLDSNNTAAQNKLALLKELNSISNRSVYTAPRLPAAVAAVAPPATPAAATSPTATAAPAKVATAAAPAPDSSKADIGNALKGWANAWANKDMKAYFASYSKDFDPPGRQSRATWEKERTDHIAGKSTKIAVDVDIQSIERSSTEEATVRFRQNYRSGGLKASGNKTVVMSKRYGRWQIVREQMGR